MTEVLDVVGLVALVVAGFLVSWWVGFAAVGSGCLVASWSVTRKKRQAVEAEQLRRAELNAR